MKKALLAASILLSSFLISSCISAQRVYVKVRPIAPVIIRPIAPSSGHFWIEPEWVWRGGRYEYVGGYWVAPRVGHRYEPGYWRHRLRGDTWIGGGWRR